MQPYQGNNDMTNENLVLNNIDKTAKKSFYFNGKLHIYIIYLDMVHVA